MPAAHVFSYSVMCPVHAHESAQGMREPSGEPVATSDRALECSRLHAGAQRHARPAFTAFEPVEPLSADLYGNNGRELPRRAAIGRRRGDDDRACRRQLGGLAAASLAERIEEERWKQQRPFPASKVAGNWVRWTRASPAPDPIHRMRLRWSLVPALSELVTAPFGRRSRPTRAA